MSRQRIFVPGFWASKRVKRLYRKYRAEAVLLYWGMVSHADDEGRGENDIDWFEMKMPILKLDKDKVNMWIPLMEDLTLIKTYDDYYFVPDWFEKQRIPKAYPSSLILPSQEILLEYPPYILGIKDQYHQIHDRLSKNNEKIPWQFQQNFQFIFNEIPESISFSESDIEKFLYEQFISKTLLFKQFVTINTERQVRIENSYLDILITGEKVKCIIEIKKGNLTNSAISQILKYCHFVKITNQEICLTLVGKGINSAFNLALCKKNKIDILIYDNDFNFNYLLNNQTHEICYFNGKITVELNQINKDLCQKTSSPMKLKEVKGSEVKRSEKKIIAPSDKNPSLNANASQDASDPLFKIPLIKRDGEFLVFQEDINQWQETFPAVGVLQKLREIRQWNIDHPTKRKTEKGIRGHITGWLAKEQNKGNYKDSLASSKKEFLLPSQKAKLEGQDHDGI